MPNKPKALSARDGETVLRLLEHHDVKTCAKFMGVGEATIYRFMREHRQRGGQVKLRSSRAERYHLFGHNARQH